MRFCPFCSAENADELAVCGSCGRRLPPLPPRRAGSRNAPPTGVQLPRPAPPSSPPPVPRKPASSSSPPPPVAAAAPRDSAPALPPPPAPEPVRQAILDAISPPPAAERRPPAIAIAPPPPRPSRPASFNDIATDPSAPPLVIADERPRPSSQMIDPPATRIVRGDAQTDRPFSLPKVLPLPEIPEPGPINAARYAITFWRANWQRRGAIKQLGVEIKQDTEALDQVLGALGRTARGARVEGKVFSAENNAITDAEQRIAALNKEHGEVEGRKAEENSKFVDVERERNDKLHDAERQVDETARELSTLEAQRRGLRDKRKEVERRQKAHLKAAEDHDRQAGAQQMGDQRQELRRTAESHRREAAALEPERQDLDRQLAGLERPISEATAKLDAAKAELDAAKRSLSDAREGHSHRLAELDAEQKRKGREIALAESEIARRLVTLGTLVNLNRIEDPAFAELYERIDRLRGAITARTTEIEKLTAEREAHDRRSMNYGYAVLALSVVALIALISIVRIIL